MKNTKIRYEEAILDIITLDSRDVITTSDKEAAFNGDWDDMGEWG